MTDPQILIDELAELAREVVASAADGKLSPTEALAIGADVVAVVEALRALTTASDPERRAERQARREARKAARVARRAARKSS